MTKIADIVEFVERLAPPALQESYDNSGLIIGNPADDCTGVLLTLDVTEATIAEAAEQGCNLIVAHHPLIFHGLKRLNGANLVERSVIAAIKAGIAIYAAHTSFDNAPEGMSWVMARRLMLNDISTLQFAVGAPNAGSGIIGTLPAPLEAVSFLSLVKKAFGCQAVRVNSGATVKSISRVALCGGSGAFLIPAAIEKRADAFVTADIKYHDFADCPAGLLLVDAGHYETEHCIVEFFSRKISEFFPTFAVRCSSTCRNPVNYK